MPRWSMALGVAVLLGGLGMPAPARAEAPATASPATASPATASPATSSPATAAPATAAPASTAPSTAAPNASGANAREQQLLERIRQLKAPRWRSYGVCRYDWSTWRLTEGGVRTAEVECGPDNSRASVAVHCDTLQVSRREGEAAWSPWRLPLAGAESKTTGGEDLMVAALCANVQSSPAQARPPAAAGPVPLKTTPASAKPATTKPASAKPASTKPAASRPGVRKPQQNTGSGR